MKTNDASDQDEDPMSDNSTHIPLKSNIDPKNNETEMMESFTIIDILKNTSLNTIIGIGVVMYWRGCWYILDNFANDLNVQHNVLKSSLQSLAISAIIPLIAVLIWFWIPNTWLNNTSRKLSDKITKKVFQYILILLFGFTNVSFWRGIWLLADYIVFPNDFQLSFCSTIIIGLLILAISQSCSSMLSPPVLSISDQDNEFYIQKLHTTATALKAMYNHYNRKTTKH